MDISPDGYALIKKSEGFRSKPYRCPAGVPTIGYGSTIYPNGKRVSMLDKPISEHTASLMLGDSVKILCAKISSLVKVHITQNQFDALVDFAYNLGIGSLSKSTLLKKLNAGLHSQASNELLKWDKARDPITKKLIKVKGLTKRRMLEKELFDKN